MITGLIPGSIGETSVIAILIGAVILLWTGVASWKTMLSVFVGGAFMAWVFNAIGMENNTMAQMPWYEHLVLGWFLLRCRIHGYRPCDIRTYGKR